jgi:hypothetical protein
MRGTENYDLAERLLDVFDGVSLDDDLVIAKAQVHATLAVAGALAALIAEHKRATDPRPTTRPSPLDLERARQ